MPSRETDVLDALVIGAGFAGICLGKRLLDAGITDFRIIDKAPGVGGTWHWNSYPGAACDVLSHFYCFSFEPNPDWSRKYAPWHEIRAYAEHCVDRFGLRKHIELGKTVQMARFDDQTRLWEVELADGGLILARHVIDGSGGLHVPMIPSIAGAGSFKGEQWHSSRWRHDIKLEGRKVAVIGSAASAVQIVPEIAKSAASVVVVQRSANYIIPRHDRSFRAFEKWCFRHLPGYGKLYRLILFLRYEWLAYPIVKTPVDNVQRRYALWLFRRMLNRHIKNPQLRKRLTPDYPIGCRRVLISDDYYPALNRDNVTLVSGEIQGITSTGILMHDGGEFEADVLIYATGFDTQGHHLDQRIVGRSGQALSAAWSKAPVAYEGCMVTGFPNYYFVTGPNTGVGSNSVICIIEQSARLIIQCIKAAGNDKLIELNQAAMEAYDSEIQSALTKTVWAASCSSWYKRDDGRITALYPYNAQTYRRRHRKLRLEHFNIAD
jgi:cation diffusion facilitator CzcD-associated flavoprotein CzcO